MGYRPDCVFPQTALRRLQGLNCVRAGLVGLLAAVAAQACSAQVADRILKPVDGSRVQALTNHRPQWAIAANDTGAAPADLKLEQMTLGLERSPQQEAALEQLLAAQQNPASPEFHHWLTAEEMGARFGLSDHDLDAVRTWLEAQGLHVNWVAPSRQFVGFGGTAAEVGRAFHAELHTYNVDGEQRFSVATDPMIPQALAPAISAVRGLFSVGDRPAHFAHVQQSAAPELSDSGDYFIAPQDFDTIYNVPSNLSGLGITIGIVGWSRVSTADLDEFRQKTGATFANPAQVVPTAYGGVDPGPAYTTQQSCSSCLSGQEEATLDVMRAGSVAQDANLLLVASSSAGSSDGIGADAQYLVQTTPAPARVISISFGDCELNEGSSGVSYWNNLFEQAAAEGISVFVSSGDSGAAGCDNAFTTPPVTPFAISPNYICSSTYATCVGGTDFNDASTYSTYWSASNSSTLGSALSYIPEGAWNEPLSSTSTMQAAASGGGSSIYIATPAWQQGVTGVPSPGTGRYTPDVAFSSSCREGYFGCMAAGGGSCVANTNGQYYFEIFCGTSAAAPGMAGVAALLDQKLNGVAQGNLNPKMYQLESNAPQAFNDVTVASSGVSGCTASTPSLCNNSVPSSTGLSGGEAGYVVGAGFDEVTGLGSLNVLNFLNNYGVLRLTPTVTVSPSPSSLTTAQGVAVTVTVSGGGGEPTPTGTVTVSSGSYISGPAALSGGSAIVNIAAGSLISGIDTLTAVYAPDAPSSATYNGSSGTNTVTVTVPAKITPAVTVSPSNASITTLQSVAVTVNVSGGNGEPTPTGYVNLISGTYNSGSVSLSTGNVTINVSAGSLAVGLDTVAVTYTPDSSSTATYNGNSGSNTVTVSKATPTVSVIPAPSSITSTESLQVTVSVSAGSGNPIATGSVTLASGSYSSGATALSGGSAVITVPAGSLAVGTDTLTANYAPDAASAGTYSLASGSGSVVVTTQVKITPAVIVAPNPSNITTAQSLQVTITVSGGSGNPTPTGSVGLASGSYTYTPTALSGGSATITIPAGNLGTGSDTLTVTYAPDAASAAIFNSASGSSTVVVSLPPNPSFTITGAPITIAAGAVSGNSETIIVAPSPGFTGNVTLAAQVSSSPVGAQGAPTLSFGSSSPVGITGTSAVTATLTIATTARTSSALHVPMRPVGGWYATGGVAIASLLLAWIPGRRRGGRGLLAMIALLIAVGAGATSCSGGSVSNGGSGNLGTTAGLYTITVTGASGSTIETAKISLTVE